MTTKNPRYSILIPTRNGMRYLPYAIDSVLSQESQDFELIVSDNHSKDGTAEYLSGLSDPRLVKLTPSTELPMASHFEFILSHAQGDWVTAIGDDDAVMPFFFEYLESLKLDSLDTPTIVFRRAYYNWEGCQELHGDWIVSYNPSPQKRLVNNNWALFLALCSITDYMYLPQLYTTGLVRNDFVRSIKERSGGIFFHGMAPDASSAAIMAINAPKHYRVEQPIFWTGTSPKSVGYSQGSTKTKERSQEFDRQNEDSALKTSSQLSIAWHKNLNLAVVLYDALLLSPSAPRFWSSGFMRHFFVAGLIMTGIAGRKVAQEVDKGSLLWLRIAPFILSFCVVRLLYQLRQLLIKTDGAKSLSSKDREKFPTIAQASQSVLLDASPK